MLYVNVNEAPTIGRLRPVYGAGGGEEWTQAQLGRQICETNCLSCHGSDLRAS